VGKASRQHHADEFGRQGSGIAGMDAPMIGAAGSIFADALTEQESGVTPPPPPISVGQLAASLAVMFVLGAVLLAIMLGQQASGEPTYAFSYSAQGLGSVNAIFGGFTVTQEPSSDYLVLDTNGRRQQDGEYVDLEAEVLVDASTEYFANDRPIQRSGAFGFRGLDVAYMSVWPCTVEYRRVEGSKRPLATKVVFTPSEAQIRGATE
jgi:hypothetical protein